MAEKKRASIYLDGEHDEKILEWYNNQRNKSDSLRQVLVDVVERFGTIDYVAGKMTGAIPLTSTDVEMVGNVQQPVQTHQQMPIMQEQVSNQTPSQTLQEQMVSQTPPQATREKVVTPTVNPTPQTYLEQNATSLEVVPTSQSQTSLGAPTPQRQTNLAPPNDVQQTTVSQTVVKKSYTDLL